ncbi:MAG: hypothetical protein AAB512_00770 [Patescibacteria group bacterium]
MPAANKYGIQKTDFTEELAPDSSKPSQTKIDITTNSKIEINVIKTTALNLPINHNRPIGANIISPSSIPLKKIRFIAKSQTFRKIKIKIKFK